MLSCEFVVMMEGDIQLNYYVSYLNISNLMPTVCRFYRKIIVLL